MTRFRIGAAVAAFGLLVGCGPGDGGGAAADNTAPSAEEGATEERVAIEIEPQDAAIRAGTTLEIHFPGGEMRATHLLLQQQRDEAWDPLYRVYPLGRSGLERRDPPELDERDWQRHDPEEGMNFDAVDGRGIQHVLVPPPAAPGRYRLCTPAPTDGEVLCSDPFDVEA